jgi:hypothetical protein
MRTAVFSVLAATSLLGACVADEPEGPLVIASDLNVEVAWNQANGSCVDAWSTRVLAVHVPDGGSMSVDPPATLDSSELAIDGQHGTLHLSYSDVWSTPDEDQPTVELDLGIHADLEGDGTITGAGTASFPWHGGICDYDLTVSGSFVPG